MSEDESVGAQSLAPLRDRLERYYREKTDPHVEISDLTAISDGWETEVYSFTLAHGGRPVSRILRLYPGADAVEKSAREYQGMSRLRRDSGYPVPSVMRHESDPAWLDKPFMIMQKIDGLPLGRVMREQPQRWPELVEQFIRLFVTLHQLDPDPFLRLNPETTPNDPSAFLAQKLAFGRALMVDQLRQTWAVPVLDWLEARMPEVRAAAFSVMHGDFHPLNVLMTAEGMAYVIDWGNIEVGDYRYDLAWTLLLAATHGGGQPEHDLFLREYERLSGHPVEQIEYFEVIAALRRLLGLTVSLTSGAASAGMRPEAAAIMRGQLTHFQGVYAILRAHTGLRLPEIERWLER